MMDNMGKPEYEQFDEYPRLRALLETKDKEEGKESCVELFASRLLTRGKNMRMC
jgi:hypothetical protein